ncbi:MAG: hypothetical protein FWD69_10310 [Polyangiaceae bacterium]|nr:hypothetical protein [Polyangiaceae bacterium]
MDAIGVDMALLVDIINYQMKAIAVAHEMEELQRAVEAADMLLDVYRWKNFPTEAQHGKAPTAIGAVLTLVHLRLAQICHVLRDEADPETIGANHNEANTLEAGVVLKPWSSRRRQQHAKEELKRVQAEIKAARSR